MTFQCVEARGSRDLVYDEGGGTVAIGALFSVHPGFAFHNRARPKVRVGRWTHESVKSVRKISRLTRGRTQDCGQSSRKGRVRASCGLGSRESRRVVRGLLRKDRLEGQSRRRRAKDVWEVAVCDRMERRGPITGKRAKPPPQRTRVRSGPLPVPESYHRSVRTEGWWSGVRDE